MFAEDFISNSDMGGHFMIAELFINSRKKEHVKVGSANLVYLPGYKYTCLLMLILTLAIRGIGILNHPFLVTVVHL